ncbi:MAG: methyl-accepting chemotaxis protein [Lachnospiraceae bacterium]|nr:methyl-accepting chemotaxis protein [Lachnospiraceae bacterium]
MKKTGFTMRKMLMMFCLVPLFVSLGIMTVTCVVYMRQSLEEQTKQLLQVSCAGVYEYYAYDLVESEGDADIEEIFTYDTEYIDHLQNMDVDLTLFKGDTRFLTSIKDDNGKRIEGTKASDAVIQTVIKEGKEFYSDDVVINGKDYYVYYIPLKTPDGKVIGMVFAGKTQEAVQGMLQKMINIAMMIAGLLLVIFIPLCIYFSNKISKVLKTCSTNIGKLSEGDLGEQEETESIIAETKDLIYSSKVLKDKLDEIIGNIKSVSGDLNNDAQTVHSLSDNSSMSVNQISNAMEDLANGATEMASNVQDISKSVGDLNDTIGVLADSSEALATSSENIKNANNEARNYIGRVSDSSVQTVEAVDNITRQISSTNDAVQKIKEAVDMITSIASQTNLLALNASIEAARAGEAGRGFAVVASEIGNLSDQSSKSAEEIRNIVGEIVKNSEASVELSGSVATLIRQEQEYIKETQSKFEVLNTEIAESLEHINQVSKDTEALEKIQSVITDAVQSLSAISEENAASNEEVSASITGIAASVDEIAESAEGTKANADNLVNTVSFFH